MSLQTIVSDIVRPYYQSLGSTKVEEECERALAAIKAAGAGVRSIAAAMEVSDLTATGLPTAVCKAIAARIREDSISTVVVTVNGHTTLRPASFDEVIGHTDFKALISQAITAARMRSEQLRHVLLSGPRGLGKTTLALAIANEMKTQARLLVGTQLKTPADVTQEVLRWTAGSVVFIDEIHGMSKAAQETLYSVLEDGRLPVSERRQGRVTQTSVPAPKVTIIGATTNPSKLLEPFRNRFGFTHNLPFYTAEEMARIGERSARILDVVLAQDAMLKIVSSCRDNPRTLNELLTQLRDRSTAQGLQSITTEHVLDQLRLNGYDEQGLRPEERRYIETLLRFGKPASLKTIAETMDIEADEVEQAIEPWLIRRGLIKRTSQGRQLVQHGLVQQTQEG